MKGFEGGSNDAEPTDQTERLHAGGELVADLMLGLSKEHW